MTVKTPLRTDLIDRLLSRFSNADPFQRLLESCHNGQSATVAGLSGSAPSFVLKSLAETTSGPIIAVCPGPSEASDLYDDLVFLHDRDRVGHFPARQILPYDFRAPVGEIMGRRISTLAGLVDHRLDIVVCSIRSLMEPTLTPSQLEDNRIELRPGQEVDLEDLVDRLVRLGYQRVAVVGEVGDFALRGGLIDFFSPGSEAPVRVELYGDEVETIREFDVSNQRTVRRVDLVSLLPKREVTIAQSSLEDHLDRLPEADADLIRARYLNDPELPGLEWLALLFGLEIGRLADFFDEKAVIYTLGEGTLRSEAAEVLAEAHGLRARLAERLTRLPEPEQYYCDPEQLMGQLHEHTLIDQVPFRGGRKDLIDFSCQPHPAFGSRLDLLGETLQEFKSTHMDYLIATDTEGQVSRLQELIADKSEIDFEPPVVPANLKGGFVCRSGGLALLTDHEIFGRHHRRVRRKKFKEGVAISDYSNLVRGDFVVHTDHGIARYLGLKTIQVDERNRDCLLLEYAEGDKLYVPIEEFNRVSKYSGKDTAPTLTRLGGPGWEKLKKKTRKAIEDMAADLLKLYAERKQQGGFSFGEDTVWLRQLESSFVFEETPDQLKAIEDVKRDMASDQPMDRLICGDVGFGKTEVAVRAVFKAIERGKQAAILVPTTILAQQHLQTFSDRLSDFPVRIEMLSRFRTRKEQLETIDNLAAGKVDLVIGTHRLFSKDVYFKDLGLLVVDEEHRFGVRHKEKLRRLKASVDTISMTATPIPRTLQMSLMGARDMSLITTSPKDRLPIITEIVEFDPAVIATAILREIDRGGQVFFVHNRVQTIDAMYRYLKKVVPQAEIVIAHGQMHEKSLEGVMLAFMSGRYNVLLCTSIIESGLDIPSTNTIIINRADRFGLAQLYQIRGRVGRSSKRAYAYLLTPTTRQLTADGVKRLRALEAHSDLGSGFALAMRDLEIRGAGTILGARQSGFIEEIGFDMYSRLLEEAVADLKGQTIQQLPETKLELDVEIHLAQQYVNNRHQKVDIYRRLADARNLDEVEKIRDEITDRFGRMPQSGVNLFDAAAVKIAAAMLEVETVRLKAGRATLIFDEDRQLRRHEVESFGRATDQPMEFSLVGRPQIILQLGAIKESDRLGYLRGVLSKI
jgi:transcription-repair coupling factor (superfamily II helicase)